MCALSLLTLTLIFVPKEFELSNFLEDLGEMKVFMKKFEGKLGYQLKCNIFLNQSAQLSQGKISFPRSFNYIIRFFVYLDMHLAISNKIDSITQLCKNHKVDELYLFGSYATGRNHEDSDIDFLVKFGNVELLSYFDNYFDLKIQLEKLLGRPVDLVENKTIRNPFLKESIEQSRQLIYG